MNNLPLDEFKKLTQEEKSKRYAELSSHDKFLCRISDSPGVAVTGRVDMPKAEQEENRKKFIELLKSKGAIKDDPL